MPRSNIEDAFKSGKNVEARSLSVLKRPELRERIKGRLKYQTLLYNRSYVNWNKLKKFYTNI